MNVSSQALWYIESHLLSDEDKTLDAIAGVAGVSRFHISRAFPAATGLPVSVYIRARKLSEAAKLLANGAPDILSVALDAGYGSHEAFTRAFRQQFGITPEQLRTRATLEGITLQEAIPMNAPANDAGITIQPARIEERSAFLVLGMSQLHQSTSAGIPSQWARFVPHLGHIPKQTGADAYGVICNVDEAASCEYISGVEVSEFPTPGQFPELNGRIRISPQRYAVFAHKGHVSEIATTWNAIWNRGLAESGCKAADGPAFERYGPEFDGRTGFGGLEIWIPIEK